MAKHSQSLYLLSLGILIVLAVWLLEFIYLPRDTRILQRAKIFPDTAEFLLWLNKKGHWHIFIFNTTNPDEVASGGKPVLKELGPYVYEEISSRTHIQFHVDRDTVSSRTFAVQKFLKDLSSGSEGDEVFVPNSPASDRAQTPEAHSRIPYNSTLNVSSRASQNRFVKMSVKNLLEGPARMKSNDRGASEKQAYTRIGPFHMYNDAQEYTEIHLGREDQQFKDIGQLVKWVGQPNLANLNGRCSNVNGTDGTIFPPNLDRRFALPVYLPCLVRSVFFKYSRDTVVNDVPGYRFHYSGNVADNYCPCKPFPTKCPHDGTFQMDLSSGLFTISLPHFLDASDQIETATAFEGLEPAIDRHQSYIELEPSSGLVLSAHYRFQLNALFDPTDHKGFHEHVTDDGRPMVFPVLWWDYQYTDLNVPAVKKAMLGSGELVSSKLGWTKWLILLVGTVVGLLGILFHVKDVAEERRRLATPSRAALISNA